MGSEVNFNNDICYNVNIMESDKNLEKINIYKQAEFLKNKYEDIKDFVLAVGDFIHKHGYSVENRYRPQSIIESRFMPINEAFEKGVLSCGAIANISADMIRHVGLQVQLIHGELIDSVDHAWISVFDKDKDVWVDFDLTSDNPLDMTNHTEKKRVDSWEEIRGVILEDHRTYEERNRSKVK